MRKQLVHLKYSGQDFVYQIKRYICFDVQQCVSVAHRRYRPTKNLKNKAIASVK
ncbi:hypothetical protein [Nostoc sp.]|uniref:hypothetical protein n=1 Tax=Nostoc sp. TaxID=1180 RepID=UPI002FFBA94F